MKPRDPTELLPLTPAVFHILLALAEGPLHGYAIMQQASRFGSSPKPMGPGTLYGTIKRMRAEGLLEAATAPPAESGPEGRRYYRLTPFGRRVVEAETERLESLVDLARSRKLTIRGQET